MSVQLRTELKQLKFLFMITSKALGLGMHKMWICNDFTLNPVCQNKKNKKKTLTNLLPSINYVNKPARMQFQT